MQRITIRQSAETAEVQKCQAISKFERNSSNNFCAFVYIDKIARLEMGGTRIFLRFLRFCALPMQWLYMRCEWRRKVSALLSALCA
jgi:hypothetical protein